MQHDSSKKSFDKGLLISFSLFIGTMFLLIIFTYKGNQVVEDYNTSESSLNKITISNNFKTIPKEEQISANQLISLFNNEDRLVKEDPLDEKDKMAKFIFYHQLPYIDYKPYRNDSIEIQFRIESNKKENSTIQRYTYQYVLEKANDNFIKGNYEKALFYFLAITNEYPNDINGNFYGAICHYNLGNYGEAADLFRNSYSTGYQNFKPEALIFLSKTYIHDNKPLKAQFWLKTIVEENGYYKEEAQNLLENLEALKSD